MNKKCKTIGLGTLIAIIVLFSNFTTPSAATVIENLLLEYTKTPIGIDVTTLRFSWQMSVTSGELNYAQTAYQIIVKDPKGTVFWDSKKITSDVSLGIRYAGTPLKATTIYNWTVTVWDQNGATSSGTS